MDEIRSAKMDRSYQLEKCDFVQKELEQQKAKERRELQRVIARSRDP